MLDVFCFWLLSLVQFGVYAIGSYNLFLFPTYCVFTYYYDAGKQTKNHTCYYLARETYALTNLRSPREAIATVRISDYSYTYIYIYIYIYKHKWTSEVNITE